MAFYNLLFFILTWSYVLNAFQLIRSSHESQKFIRSGQLGAPRSLPLRDSMSATLGIDPETVKALNELQGAVSSGVSSGNALIDTLDKFSSSPLILLLPILAAVLIGGSICYFIYSWSQLSSE
eukprot:gene2408-2557_t